MVLTGKIIVGTLIKSHCWILLLIIFYLLQKEEIAQLYGKLQKGDITMDGILKHVETLELHQLAKVRIPIF